VGREKGKSTGSHERGGEVFVLGVPLHGPGNEKRKRPPGRDLIREF
jgi:hypothetical protein